MVTDLSPGLLPVPHPPAEAEEMLIVTALMEWENTLTSDQQTMHILQVQVLNLGMACGKPGGPGPPPPYQLTASQQCQALPQPLGNAG